MLLKSFLKMEMPFTLTTKHHLSLIGNKRFKGRIAGFKYVKDNFTDSPPKLFVGQDSNVETTGKPPYNIQRVWMKGNLFRKKKFLGKS